MVDSLKDIRLATVIHIEECYYFTVLGWNALLLYDCNTGEIKYLGSFDISGPFESLYIKSFYCDDEIWFVPSHADKIAFYNIKKRDFGYISLEGLDFDRSCSKEKFNGYLVIGTSEVLFVPRGINDVIIIDIKKRCIKKIIKVALENEEYQNAFVYDNKIHLYPRIGDKKAIIDMETFGVEYKACEGSERYCDVVYDDKTGYLYHAPGTDNHILIDDILGNQIKKIAVSDSYNNKYRSYFACIHSNNVFFWGEKDVIVMSTIDNSVRYIKLRDEDVLNTYIFPVESTALEGYVYGGDKIFVYNDEIGKKSIIDLKLNKADLIRKKVLYEIQSGKIYKEYEGDLKTYISVLG